MATCSSRAPGCSLLVEHAVASTVVCETKFCVANFNLRLAEGGLFFCSEKTFFVVKKHFHRLTGHRRLWFGPAGTDLYHFWYTFAPGAHCCTGLAYRIFKTGRRGARADNPRTLCAALGRIREE